MLRRFATPILLLIALCACGTASAHAAVFSGKLEVRHSDDFGHGRGQTTWKLRTHGRRIPILPTRAVHARNGDRVAIKGRRAGHWIEGKVRRRGGPRVRKASAIGEHSVAVILFNFASDTREPWTPAEVESSILGSTTSTAAFFSEESYGDIELSGTVYGWHTISAPTAGCDVDLWASQARAATGVDLSAYDHVAYVFPQQSSCGWAGLGELPGEQTWMNGTTAVRVVAHELGHNMALHHASSLSCTSGGASVTWSSSCSASEYGDPFDVMGLNARHNSAWHLAKLGVLGSANIQTASVSGTYTISSALARRAGPVLLRVPTGSSSAYYYDVEIRESGGVFDNWSSTAPVVNGVSIRWDPQTTTIKQSMLLDATPGSGSGFTDSPLAEGETFSDGSISVTATSVAPGTATVDVVRGPYVDNVAPSAPRSLSAQTSTRSVALSWFGSTDNVGVAGYRVYRDDLLIGTTTDRAWTDGNRLPGATHTYQVAAFDAAGNATSSSPVFATVPADPAPPPPPPPPPPPLPPADTTAPAVDVVSPGNRTRLRRARVVIEGSASDDDDVDRMEIWIDGRRRSVADGPTIRRTWVLRRVRVGAHKIRLRAVDSSGNVGSRTVRVRVEHKARSARRAARRR